MLLRDPQILFFSHRGLVFGFLHMKHLMAKKQKINPLVPVAGSLPWAAVPSCTDWGESFAVLLLPIEWESGLCWAVRDTLW